MLYPAMTLILLVGIIRLVPHEPTLAILQARNQRLVVYDSPSARLIWSHTPLSETEKAYVLNPYAQIRGNRENVEYFLGF